MTFIVAANHDILTYMGIMMSYMRRKLLASSWIYDLCIPIYQFDLWLNQHMLTLFSDESFLVLLDIFPR